MKTILKFSLLTIFVLIYSCNTESVISDDELIEQIINSKDKISIAESELPSISLNYLDKEYEEDFLMGILEKDLQSAIDQADDMCKNLTISDDAKIIIIEMIFQLGGTGVSKFRKMWQALQQDPPDYAEASVQMLDSRWAKQTPNRAKEMARHMSECVV